MLNLITGQYAFVAKVAVSNMDNSVQWYTTKLDFVVDRRFVANPYWMQLNMPGLPRVAMGLSADTPYTSSPHPGPDPVATFVVADIKLARQTLIDRGVDTMSKIQDVGQGVYLAFFQDPDKNWLGLRQNSPQEPKPSEVGWQPGQD
ncbi:MAG TPA: VOC family protein [Thermoanaerobaculia bacterium]|nr:VOC family protein [Thermoanaerobaculia bacterium]